MAQQMFGSFDPELLKQAIATEEERNLLSQAQLSPAQMQNLIQLRSGQMLGKGVGQIVGGIFGVEAQDPRLRQAQMAQEAYQEALQASGGDANSPQFFQALANSAARRNLPTLAQQAATQASTLASEQMQAFQRQAAGIRALRENEPVVKTPADFAAVAVELGYGSKPNINDYTAAQAEQVNALLQQRSEKKAAAGVPQTPTEKAILPGKAKLLGDVETSALNASKTLETASALDRVLNTAFTGFGADAKLRVGQVANALGVTVSGTSETEQLKQLLAQLAQGQAKTLPGALSEKELAFLREAIGTPGFTVNTLRNVVNRLRTDSLASQFENQFAQDYVMSGGDLNKYNFVDGKKRALDQAKTQIQLTTDKMKRLEELRAKQRGQ